MDVSLKGRRTSRRDTTILVGSLMLHGAVLAWLALPAPPLLSPTIVDDLPIVTVDLTRPEPETRARPRPAPASAAIAASPVLPFTARAPLRSVPANVPALSAPIAPAGALRPGAAIRPAPLPGDGAGDLRAALRASATGCVSADAVGLNRRERERCDERFGAAKARGEALSGMDPAKRAGFDAQAAGQEAYRRYKEGSMGPGVDHRSREHPGTMKEIPFVLGAEQDGLGRPHQAVIDQHRIEQNQEESARTYLKLRKKAGAGP